MSLIELDFILWSANCFKIGATSVILIGGGGDTAMNKLGLRSKNSFVPFAILTAATVAFTVSSGAARAEERPCESPGKLVRISGTIMNNALGPGETLGTIQAHLVGSKKMECGIHGVAHFNPDGTFGFTHSIVCDDRVRVENSTDTIHSQIVSLTHFDGVPDFHSCGVPGMEFGTFRDISEPQSGRGIFSPTGGGQLFIEGTVNCAGAVDMSFFGDVCVVRPKRGHDD
jgi:hypothetical protein